MSKSIPSFRIAVAMNKTEVEVPFYESKILK
jgi:hypothetical protein